jgi:hypothetical protein
LEILKLPTLSKHPIVSSTVTAYHGHSGPLKTSIVKVTAIADYLVEAAKELNLTSGDYNAEEQIGKASE